MIIELLCFIGLIIVMMGGAAAMYCLIRELARWILEDDNL